jgi:hypothetical protein
MGQSIIDRIQPQSVIYDNQAFMEESDRMLEGRRMFWDMELGGLGTASEFIRRIYPNRRFVENWQPLPVRNKMPSWMPGFGELENFQIGDPYQRIAAGEIRLPGAGYALRRPDLKGMNAEDYDIATRLEILADTAPYSKAFKHAQKQFQKGMELKILTEDQMMRGRRAMLIRQHMITPHKYAAEAEDATAKSMYYKTMSEFAKSSPFERLIPFSPGHKFIGNRTAIDKYRDYLEFGGDMASWARPVEDFVLRAFKSFSSMFNGDLSVPISDQVQRVRDVNNSFNALRYIKGDKVSKQSSQAYAWVGAKNTVPGINPYEADMDEILNAMPKQERAFFFAFAEEKSFKRQKEILKMVPQEHQRIYKAMWARKLVHQLRSDDNTKDSYLARRSSNRAASIIRTLQHNEFHYKETRGLFRKKESQIRMDIAKDIIRRGGGNMPANSWLGWNKNVKLKDVQLKHIMNEGEDIHQYGFWEPQKRDLEYKDLIDEIASDYANPYQLMIDNFANGTADALNREKRIGYMSSSFSSYSGNGSYSNYDIYRTPSDMEIINAYAE